MRALTTAARLSDPKRVWALGVLLTVVTGCAGVSTGGRPSGITPPRGPSGADGTYNCADFDTHTQAQRYHDHQGGVNSGDLMGSDRDHDGLA